MRVPRWAPGSTVRTPSVGHPSRSGRGHASTSSSSSSSLWPRLQQSSVMSTFYPMTQLGMATKLYFSTFLNFMRVLLNLERKYFKKFQLNIIENKKVVKFSWIEDLLEVSDNNKITIVLRWSLQDSPDSSSPRLRLQSEHLLDVEVSVLHHLLGLLGPEQHGEVDLVLLDVQVGVELSDGLVPGGMTRGRSSVRCQSGHYHH